MLVLVWGEFDSQLAKSLIAEIESVFQFFEGDLGEIGLVVLLLVEGHEDVGQFDEFVKVLQSMSVIVRIEVDIAEGFVKFCV